MSIPSKQVMIDLAYVKILKLPPEGVQEIKRLIEEKRYSMRQLALLSKDRFSDKDKQISHIFLSKLLSGSTDGVSVEKLHTICTLLDTSIEQILPNSLVRVS